MEATQAHPRQVAAQRSLDAFVARVAAPAGWRLRGTTDSNGGVISLDIYGGKLFKIPTPLEALRDGWRSDGPWYEARYMLAAGEEIDDELLEMILRAVASGAHALGCPDLWKIDGERPSTDPT